MGSKTPEGHQQTPDGSDSVDFKAVNPDFKLSRNASSSANLGSGDIGGGDDDDDADAKEEAGISVVEKKKKRNRSKKKNTKAATSLATEQTSPPRVLVSTLFPSAYPVGERVPYENTSRTTNEELRYNSRPWDDANFLTDYRQAAEIHRQVRQYAQKELIKPRASLLSIAEGIEDGVRALSGHQGFDGDGLKASMGFPTGLCLNNIAAHWTPNPGGKVIVLAKSDVLKVDFGVHVNGRIVDSAFTVTFEPTYDNLLTAVKEATNTGIKHAGIDARMSEIGAAIQEVMESYEVEVAGKSLPVRAIRSITGHNILRYHIHGGKSVPFVRNNSQKKMEEGEVFAIETFGSTGKGRVYDDVGIYGYGRQDNASAANLRLSSAKALLKTIHANFGTIVFCRRYLERLGVTNYHLGIGNLMHNGIVESYAHLSM